MRFTINDIARKAGVSRATVSRVINNKPDVEENTRLNVLKIMEEANYVPSNMATGLRTRKTNIIALLTTNPSHPAVGLNQPWSYEVFLGILEKLEEYGYKLLLYTPNFQNDTPENSREFTQFLNNGLADGLIVLFPSFIQDYLNKLAGSGLPYAVINDLRNDEDINSLKFFLDDYQAACQATRHLIKLGHQQIAFICSPPEYQFSKERLEGYKAALAEANLPFNPDLVAYSPEIIQEEAGYEACLDLIDRNKPSTDFTAIFAPLDLLAFGALRALNERGLRVPEDISLVGFDDLPRAAYSVPALTTIHYSIREVGHLAVKNVIDKIEGKPLDLTNVELGFELKIRASTRAI